MRKDNSQQYILQSPAKINLFLKVVGKEENGYHNLESVLTCINLYDNVILSITEQKTTQPLLKTNITGQFAHQVKNHNLIFNQIFDYFVKNYQINFSLEAKIEKNIPVGAGLGGGSSNGATFMKFLNEIGNIGLSKEDLQNISFNFGSDLAFFFEDQAAIVRGRGFISGPYLNSTNQEILLIYPDIFCSTKEIFNSFCDEFLLPENDATLNQQSLIELIKNYPNLLQSCAKNIYPKILEIINFLEEQNGIIAAKMTGSGSSCFAIFDSNSNLDLAMINCQKQYQDYFIKRVKIVDN